MKKNKPNDYMVKYLQKKKDTEAITRVVAIILAFLSVYFFFIKLVFL
jgi:uncharacterized membrane protein